MGMVAAVPVGQVYEVEVVELGAADDVADEGGNEDDVATAAEEGIDVLDFLLVTTAEGGADTTVPVLVPVPDPDPDCTATSVTQTTLVDVDITVVEVMLVTVTVE